MRVIMTGGGTGGHIYPAIAIADRIKERNNNGEILFVGTKRGLEKEIVPKHGYDIKFITVSGINRSNPIKNFKVVKDYMKGKKEAKKIIEEFKPDLVIGTGGYVCGPVIKMASKMGIKCYVHEQNAIPGMTNKMLEKVVENVFLGFEEAGKFFKQKEKHILAGNPVRDEFFKARKDVARETLGISPDDFVVLSFGGSQGAAKLNKAMMTVVEEYNGRDDVKVFFGTGKRYYEPIVNELAEIGVDVQNNIKIMPYIDNMQNYIAAADLVISRSGALTVSEIAVCGTPSILIPSPNVAGNHQMFNAQAVAGKGGAVLLEEKDLSGEKLVDEIKRLEKDEKLLNEMAKNARLCAPLDASDIIYYVILNR